jgi:hypothetical protein
MIRQSVNRWRVSLAAIGCLSLTLVAIATEVGPVNAGSSGGSAHQEIALDTKVMQGYVGTYQFGESAVLTVTWDGTGLFAQLTGQPTFQIYPQSAAEFFYKVVNAQISFLTDPQGAVSSLILHQNDRNITMPRIDPAVARQIATNTAAKVQSQTPTPGSEAALRRLIAGIVSGKPNYGEMSPELAEATRQQLSMLQPGIAGLGAVRSVAFQGVGNAGWDIYAVEQEHGSTQWRIALRSDGIISGALVTMGP